ncbi:MAG: hypothetical protein HQL53_14500 [Magnetococcales bacterium]|nr:hypothetical protein [Magnetococcales bacterium]
MHPSLSRDGKDIIIRIPMKFRRVGKRKRIIPPKGAKAEVGSADLPALPEVVEKENPLLQAVIKAHIWRDLMESGKVGSMRELAEKEGVDSSYVGRTVRLTLLAPDIVGLILEGEQPEAMTVNALRRGFPVEWDRQRARWGINVNTA